MYKRLVFIFVIIQSFTACNLQKDIDNYDYEFEGNRLVLQALLTNEGDVKAYITRSLSPIDRYARPYIDAASVFVYQENTCIDTLVSDDNYLFVNTKKYNIDHNKTYYLQAQSPGLPDVSSQPLKVPQAVPIDTAWIIQKMAYIQFTDPANIDNFYYNNYVPYYAGIDKSNQTHPQEFHVGVISDADFNGKSYIFSFYEFVMLYHDFEPVETDSVELQLWNVSPNMYDFARAYDDYNFANGDAFFEYPVPIESNIIGGYGTFTTLGVSRYMVVNLD